MSDALADARQALARLARMAALRGAGLVAVRGGAGGACWRWLSYHADDASLNNANGCAMSPICWARWARWPLIFCCRLRLRRRWRFLAPPVCVGRARASRQDASICHVAAAGLAAGHRHRRGWAWHLFRARQASRRRRRHDRYCRQRACLPMPAQILARHFAGLGAALVSACWPGLPLAFLATGLRFMPIARGIMQIPAAAIWFAGLIQKPNLARQVTKMTNTIMNMTTTKKAPITWKSDEDASSRCSRSRSPRPGWPSGAKAASSARRPARAP